ncbi:MAG: hypothetical protein GHCLOJNM_03733 [bacterium]|nr:hypothetical protein [bacterium]
MIAIKKQVVMDESNHPVAVQIPYSEWVEIERLLDLGDRDRDADSLESLKGTITLTEDPVEFQKRMRGEWD